MPGWGMTSWGMLAVKDFAEEHPKPGIGSSTTCKEDTMKKLIVLPAVLLLLACQDHNPVQPELEVAPELVLAQAPGGKVKDAKMVPFKGKGTYQYLAFVPDDDDKEIEIRVAIEGTATHLGRFQGEIAMLFEFMLIDGTPVPIGYLSHSGIFTAANGDELHNEGSAGPQGPVMEFREPHGSGFSLAGIPIVGGTGRFESAIGEFVLLVSRDPYDPAPPGGTWELEGELSTVGSSKR